MQPNFDKNIARFGSINVKFVHPNTHQSVLFRLVQVPLAFLIIEKFNF